MVIELERRKTGERSRVLGFFNDKDHFLEIRREGTLPITKQLAKADVPKFLAGEQVPWSYTYLVKLVHE